MTESPRDHSEGTGGTPFKGSCWVSRIEFEEYPPRSIESLSGSVPISIHSGIATEASRRQLR